MFKPFKSCPSRAKNFGSVMFAIFRIDRLSNYILVCKTFLVDVLLLSGEKTRCTYKYCIINWRTDSKIQYVLSSYIVINNKQVLNSMMIRYAGDGEFQGERNRVKSPESTDY